MYSPSGSQRCCPPPRREPCCSACCCQPKDDVCDTVLLQKVISCQHRTFSCLTADLCFPDLCCQKPLTLVSVTESGAQPCWTPLESCHANGCMPLRIDIPVCGQICDACGCSHCACSSISVKTEVPMRSCSCAPNIAVRARVRLLQTERCSDDLHFCVQLCVSLEIYLLEPKTYHIRPNQNGCPDLPLYPPPITPNQTPCWPQCPAAPDRCGWPKRG